MSVLERREPQGGGAVSPPLLGPTEAELPESSLDPKMGAGGRDRVTWEHTGGPESITPSDPGVSNFEEGASFLHDTSLQTLLVC